MNEQELVEILVAERDKPVPPKPQFSPDQIHLAKELYRYWAAIPAEQWTQCRNEDDRGRRCAFGWLLELPEHKDDLYLALKENRAMKAQALFMKLSNERHGMQFYNDLGNGQAKDNILNALKQIIGEQS